MKMSGIGGDGHGVRGLSSSYSTIRKGLRTTTSKLIGATSSVKKIPASVSFDRSSSLTSERSASDPTRFVDGVTFKGKLIGVLEVTAARGDKMCQSALGELKNAVKVAGEHKQKIVIAVAMDGIRITDERTSDCLYHHPVHKISFIAQDITDPRAFGYIFGSPDAGHKFFGIKTEKTASLVVAAMRDLFQVVFEKKKEEIANARAQLEQSRDNSDNRERNFSPLFGINGDTGIVSASLTSGAGGALADLLDLQSELSSLQRGLSELSKRSQNSQSQSTIPKMSNKNDPFGDSFKPNLQSLRDMNRKPTAIINMGIAPPKGMPCPLAPPPSSGRARHDSRGHQVKTDFGKFPVDFKNFNQAPFESNVDTDRYAVFKSLEGSEPDMDTSKWRTNDDTRLNTYKGVSTSSINRESSESRENNGQIDGSYDFFTDLDPLGIQEQIKKDMLYNGTRTEISQESLTKTESFKTNSGIACTSATGLVVSSHYANSAAVMSQSIPTLSRNVSLPVSARRFGFGYDQKNVSEFGHKTISEFGSKGFEPMSYSERVSENFADSPRSFRSESSSSAPAPSISASSLPTTLPPECFRDSPPPFSPPPPPPRSPDCRSESPKSSLSHKFSPSARHKLMRRAFTASVPPTLSPKTLPRNHRYQDGEVFNPDHHDINEAANENVYDNKRGQSYGITSRPRPTSSLSRQKCGSSTLPLRCSSGSDSFKYSSNNEENLKPFPKDFNEDIPEPPPRPAYVAPPPLPPKKYPSHVTLPPPSRPSLSDTSYQYGLASYTKSSSENPPLPAPIKKSSFFSNHESNSRVSDTFNTLPYSKSPHNPGDSFSTLTTRRSSSRGSTTSLSSIQEKPRSACQKLNPASIDLANTSLDQLALMLNVPVEKLAKMTVVELAACLAQLQLKSSQPEVKTRISDDGYEIPMEKDKTFNRNEVFRSRKVSQNSDDGTALQNQIIAKKECKASIEKSWKTSKYSENGIKKWATENNWKQKFELDGNEEFARFDAEFPKSPVDSSDATQKAESKFPLGEPVSEDRYAVFKELNPSKVRSIFDENFLTPQNSMEDRVSEVSSRETFKMKNCQDYFHNDSFEQKSSYSDDGARRSSERIDHECVTVFRSPDISEYENFEPNFEYKFEEDFSNVPMSEQSITPINSRVPSVSSNRICDSASPHLGIRASPHFSNATKSEISHSPFLDDFSKMSNLTSSDANDTVDSSDTTIKCDIPKKISHVVHLHAKPRRSTSDKSPFDDNFSDSNPTHSSEYNRSIDEKDDEVFHKNIALRCGPLERSATKGNRDVEYSVSSDIPQSPFDDDFANQTAKYEVLHETDHSPFEGDTDTLGEVEDNKSESDHFSNVEEKLKESQVNSKLNNSVFSFNEVSSNFTSQVAMTPPSAPVFSTESSPETPPELPKSAPPVSNVPSVVLGFKTSSIHTEAAASGDSDVSLEEHRESSFEENFSSEVLNFERKSTELVQSPVNSISKTPPAGLCSLQNKSSDLVLQSQPTQFDSQKQPAELGSKTSPISPALQPPPSPDFGSQLKEFRSPTDLISESEQTVLDSRISPIDNGTENNRVNELPAKNQITESGDNFADFENAFNRFDTQYNDSGVINHDAIETDSKSKIRKESLLTKKVNSFLNNSEKNRKNSSSNRNESLQNSLKIRQESFTEFSDSQFDDDIFPSIDPNSEFRVSARYPKAGFDPKDIFRRDSDPFSDEFFEPDPSSSSERASPKFNSAPFWHDPFSMSKFK